MLPLRLRLLKFADRVLGRWLCNHGSPAASLNGMPARGWSQRAIPPDEVERILVIRPGGIGDATLMYPMLNALRAYFREAEIDVLGERRNAGVFDINDLVRKVHLYDRNPLRSHRRLTARRYQLIIDTEQFHYLSCIAANYLRPEYICGFDTVGRGRLQTHRVRYSDRVYEARAFLDLASAVIGQRIEFDPNAAFLDIDRRWIEWADDALAKQGGRPTVVIVPTASSEHRFWPVERYAEVARRLAKRGYLIVVLGGRDADHAAHVIEVDAPAGAVQNLAGRTSLAQTAGILKQARLYISADTGALHIAYGVGTPTVHMFGSGIQEKWAPQGRRYVVVHKDLPCSPCTRYGYTPPCPYGVACMDAISVEDVMRAIDEVLV